MKMLRSVGRLFSLRQLPQSGDTIVEVLISMSILSLVLAVAFVSASHSLQSGTDATNRQQALAIAQQQLETIKNAANLSSLTGTPYITNSHFCIASDGTVKANTGSPSPCQNINGQPYNIDVTHTSSSTNTLFTITATWASNNNGPQNSETLYYKIPLTSGADTTKGPIVAQTCSAVSGSISTTGATVSGTVNPNGTATTYIFNYGTSSTTLNSKAPSTGPVGIGSASGDQAVSQPLSGLASAQIYYFSLIATNSFGTSSCRGTFTTLGVPSVGLSATAYSIYLGQSTQLSWVGSNITTCTSSSPGNWAAANTAPSGSLTLTPPVGTTVYTITCNGPGGSATSNQATVTVLNLPLQIAFCADNYGAGACSGNANAIIPYGSTTTFRWTVTNASSCSTSNWSASITNGSGSTATGTLYANNSFGITCTGLDQTTQTKTITVSIPPPPTNPNQSCTNGGTSATISWNKAPGYAYNYVRLMDVSTGNWVEYSVYGDGNAENYPGSSYSWASTPGHSYNWWVHTKDPTTGSWSNTVGSTLYCPPPPPVIYNFSANQGTIYSALGANRTFTVSTANTSYCTINGTSVTTNGGTQALWLYPYTNYVLYCHGDGGDTAAGPIVFDYQPSVAEIDDLHNREQCSFITDTAHDECWTSFVQINVYSGILTAAVDGVCATFTPGGYWNLGGDYLPVEDSAFVFWDAGHDCNGF